MKGTLRSDFDPYLDPYNLQRFVSSQAEDYETALMELQRGKKESHWIWYVFPQLSEPSSSPMAQHYAIRKVGSGSITA
jgi:uncharacterized protein (DUF1810 family)